MRRKTPTSGTPPPTAGPGATRKERLLRAKMKKKIKEEAEKGQLANGYSGANGTAGAPGGAFGGGGSATNGGGDTSKHAPHTMLSSGVNVGFEDILQMSDLSEENLLLNLRNRYERDRIYTFVGPIVIAINPYKPMDNLYDEQVMKHYYGKAMGSLPPHVFALADHAYTQLIQGGALYPANQSIIISGESGAGKTETTKIIMQYLARATSYRNVAATTNSTVSSDTHQPQLSRALGKLEERVLESNPLLESFGNAKTLRNDNSSRFGKFIEIQFNHHGKIVGAEIMNFLLEKTRIVSQSLHERNYHIFYQLLAGADNELRERLELKSPQHYEYLCHSGCFDINSIDEKEEFETTKRCMSTIGINKDRQSRVFDVLAAVLHLGNVQFYTGEGDACSECTETSRAGLVLVAKLLGVEFDALQSALVSRKLFVGGKVIVQSQTMDQVRDKRDALAKSIYSSIFLWLVSELNRTISKPTEKWGFIGVLDIYGFEKFQWNTFEQLCINYANEKLQRHFNQHMLEVEQEEYAKEGIDWQHISFVDNQQCLDLIEGKPGGKPGILNTLDDIWRLKGEEANKKFVSLLHVNFGREPPNQPKTQHAWYVHPKVDANLHFGIRHYAGDVVYDASGFNDKNNETLNDDMKDLLRQSECEFVRDMFDLNMQSMEAVPGATRRLSDHPNFSRRPSPTDFSAILPSPNKSMAGIAGSPAAANAVPGVATGKSRNLREVSVGAQFRFQLQELMNKISLANPRYVRCIKPNEYKQAGDLCDVDCARQLKYSGMMEAIQIRQRGFALREDHDVFFYDYQSLAPHAETIGELVEHISTTLGAGKDQWQLGKTKVFLKREISFKLRKLEVLRCKAAARTLQRWCRTIKANEAAILIQCQARRFFARRQLVRLRTAAYHVMGVLRTRLAMRKYRDLVVTHRVHTMHAIVIQRYARGFLIRKQNLLKPFEGLSPQQLDDRIAAKEKEIAKSASMKQFDLCNLLQRELEHMVEARKKNRTRQELEQEISALQVALQNAMTSKDFGKCASIQNEILELENMRQNIQEDLNELDATELDERIQAMEKRIGVAMQERAFELCGQLQEELEGLKKIRKQKMTPEEMDVEIQRLNGELESLLQQKEFAKCSEVQKQIDALKRKRSKMKSIPKRSPEPAPANEPEELPAAPAQTSVPDTGIPPIHPGGVMATTIPTTTRVSSQSDPNPLVTPMQPQAASTTTAAKPVVINPAQSTMASVRRTSMPATMDQSPVLQANKNPSISRMASDPLNRSSVSMSDLKQTNDASNLRSSFVDVPRQSLESTKPSLETSPNHTPLVPRTSATFLPQTRHRSESGGSVISVQSLARASGSTKSSTITKHDDSVTRAVERLVLARALTVSEHSSVQEAAELMRTNNQAAVLVINEQGELAGILTDTDIAHRVVAKGLDTKSTSVGPVMTLSPKCIMSDEKAVDALNTMLRGKLRHLPVVSKQEGHVLGVLNASSCLHDAIRTMEMTVATLEEEKAKVNSSATKLKLISMLQRLFSPSLADVLAAHKTGSAPLVYEDHSVRHATNLMASSQMPVLVVSEGPPSRLVGILTPKDLIHRVVAMGYDFDQTRVADVMTPSPECANPHTSSLDAFHLMHDGKFLSLPVVDSATGNIHGLVDAISLCYATFCSSECPELGALWLAALDNKSLEDESAETRRRADQACGFQVRPVSTLRLAPAVTIGENASVFEASILMKQKRSSALLVIDVMQGGALTGILTDGDISRRVLAQKLKPEQTTVGNVMTRNIQFIGPQESAIDALLMMKEGQYRHLPVVDQESGVIGGVLNIGECLYDLSKRLEHSIQSSEKMQALIEKSGVMSGSSMAFRQIVNSLMDKLNPPTLASILQREVKPFMRAAQTQGKTPALTHLAPRVHLDTSVAEAAQYLASTHKAALVVDDNGCLRGMFTPDEMVMEVIAKRLDPWNTPVGQVMCHHPETLYPSSSVVDALRFMYDSQLLYLPILTSADASQSIVGLLDVLALSFGTIDAIYGKDQAEMQQFWQTALQLDPASTSSSIEQTQQQSEAPAPNPIETQRRHDKVRTVAELNPSSVQTISETSSVQELAQVLGESQAGSALVVSADGLLVGIVTDTDLALKVVAENRSPVTTRVREIMTNTPRFVSAHEPAIDALCTMLENRVRHLPVMDEAQGGSIIGQVDISKCLYEAVTKVEKHEQKSTSLRQNLDRTASSASTAASTSTAMSGFSNMLGPILEKYLALDIRGLLEHDSMDPLFVQSYTSVYEVCKQMALAKKAAALVVSNRGQFFGIFSPAELLVNVLAKGLPFQTTPVCEVMNDDAVTILPTCSVSQAMQTMYKHNTLYLAVLQSENSRHAIGIVDVISLSYGSFAKGQSKDWQAFWNALLELEDDSVPALPPVSHSVDPVNNSKLPARKTGDPRPVSKLKPSSIVSILDSSNVADAAKEMSRARVDAALVLSSDGLLRGILTDTDMTRRVVALGKDPVFVNVCDSMTASPRFVEENESAMDAMFAMLDGKFRHLPVVDSQGIVSGMLFIQKCLHDAILRLEKAQQASSGVLRSDLQKQLMSTKLGAGLVGLGNDAAIQQLVGPMLERLLSPPLETILEQDHFPPLVSGHDTVMEVARQMAASRKGALIVEDLVDFAPPSFRDTMPTAHGKKLIGIFTPRDLLLRVVGSGLDAASTLVSQVMTPNPETAPPNMSLLDAMHAMNERRIMHLPVVEHDTGLIRGMVDVLSLCFGSFAHGSNASKGNASGVDSSEWRAFWDMSLTLTCDEESETTGRQSRATSSAARPNSTVGTTQVPYAAGSSHESSMRKSAPHTEAEGARPVSKLRPRSVTHIDEFMSVVEAAKAMRQSRCEAVVVTRSDGQLKGILTDSDITRRVLAQDLDPESITVASIMTSNPSCVYVDDPAIEAISKMMEGHFKHLPVLGSDGIIQGMLDISRCLYDAISLMEKVQHSTEAAADEMSRGAQRMLAPMMEKMVHPTISMAIQGEPCPPIVQVYTTARDVAKLMAQTGKAAIVLDRGSIVGLVTFKDMLRKLVSRNLSADNICAEEIMSTDPECLRSDTRVLDGLRVMHESGQLFVPVLTSESEIAGMADVLCLAYGQFANTAGANESQGGWRSFWQSIISVQEDAHGAFDFDESNSVGTIEEFERSEQEHAQQDQEAEARCQVDQELHHVVPHQQTGPYSELGDSVSVVSGAQTSVLYNKMGDEMFVFKVSDRNQSHYHRLLCRYDNFAMLTDKVKAKMNLDVMTEDIRLKYEDEDGDLALLSSDESLLEAVSNAKSCGMKRLVVLVDIIPKAKETTTTTTTTTTTVHQRNLLGSLSEDQPASFSSTFPDLLNANAPASRALVRRKKQKEKKKMVMGGSAFLLGVSGLAAAAMVMLNKKS